LSSDAVVVVLEAEEAGGLTPDDFSEAHAVRAMTIDIAMLIQKAGPRSSSLYRLDSISTLL
jgi:hypothetical protein